MAGGQDEVAVGERWTERARVCEAVERTSASREGGSCEPRSRMIRGQGPRLQAAT